MLGFPFRFIPILLSYGPILVSPLLIMLPYQPQIVVVWTHLTYTFIVRLITQSIFITNLKNCLGCGAFESSWNGCHSNDCPPNSCSHFIFHTRVEGLPSPFTIPTIAICGGSFPQLSLLQIPPSPCTYRKQSLCGV